MTFHYGYLRPGKLGLPHVVPGCGRDAEVVDGGEDGADGQHLVGVDAEALGRSHHLGPGRRRLGLVLDALQRRHEHIGLVKVLKLELAPEPAKNTNFVVNFISFMIFLTFHS